MGTRDLDKFGADGMALAWAAKTFAFGPVERVSQAVWATTYRLELAPPATGKNSAHAAAAPGPAARAYLKLLPPSHAAMAASTQQLAQRFAQHIPTVLAHDAGQGWLLSADHGGRTLDYDSPDAELLTLMRGYARLQADAAGDAALLAALPHAQLASLPQRLLNFLKPAAEVTPVPGQVQAEYFLGAEGAAHALRLLQGYAGVLADFIAPAAELPSTINHGDLRPPNAAIGANGQCVLMDWDDASVGPAGLSLHGMFSGCTRPIILLSGSAAAQAQSHTPAYKSVQAYVRALSAAGYASRATLLRALPASICAGMLQFILNFAQFPDENNRYDIQDTVQDRITNLLDLCDLLATKNPAVARARAASYEASGDWRRARALLQDLVAHNPAELALYTRMAVACRNEGDAALAEQLLQHVARRAPQDATAQQMLGELRLARLDLPGAARALNKALALDASLADSQAALQRIGVIRSLRRDAAVRSQVPIVRYDAGDAEAGRQRPELAALGAELFDKYGIVQIDNAFPVALIQKLQKRFFERYSAYFQTDNHPDALHVGDRRYMLTVDIEDPFDDPQLLGSATVLPIIKKVLGDEVVLGAFTAVISLPGSRDQRLHKDHPSLFPGTPHHFTVPPFAAQIIIPLVPLDAYTGTTRFYKGSHKVRTDASEALGHQDPMAPLGSCLLNDYRCAHRGLGNRSDVVRPILTLIFNRPWFHDYANYGKQPPLRLPQGVYDKMPEDLQDLLSWWKEEQKVVKLEQQALR